MTVMSSGEHDCVGHFVHMLDHLQITKVPGDNGPGAEFDHDPLIEYWRKKLEEIRKHS